MDDTFVWPAGVMLAGAGVWVLLVVWRATISRLRKWPAWVEPGLMLTAGGLVLFSGVSCLLIGGPLIGQIVRLGLLLGMTAHAYWKFGKAVTRALLVMTVVEGVLVLVAAL